MMEAGGSAKRVPRQFGHSNCVVRKCWDQWIREMSFTRRPVSGYLRQTCCRWDRHIVRNARVKPTASSTAIQAHVAFSRCLLEPYEGTWLKDIGDRGAHYVFCP
ncbi:uncharacterized protein TNCV_3795941 [Trichonephila clavipes]|nr:uncharacterized protein TNCV_3795941 [Trichonephila clavipes]